MVDPRLPELGAYSPRFRAGALAGLALVMIAVWVFAGGMDKSWKTLAGSAVLFAALLGLSAFDLKAHILPDALTLPLLLAGLGFSVWSGQGYLWSGLGAMAGYGLIAGLRCFWMRRRGVEAIGLGDAKMLGAGGAWVGAAGLPIILLIASGSALLILALSGGLRSQRAVPFGVFLALGIWGTWCLGVSFVPIGVK